MHLYSIYFSLLPTLYTKQFQYITDFKKVKNWKMNKIIPITQNSILKKIAIYAKAMSKMSILHLYECVLFILLLSQLVENSLKVIDSV